jgi:hypothetical protein
VGEQLREVEMHIGTAHCIENQGGKLRDVQHPDMRASFDQEPEDDCEEHANNHGMNLELTCNGQPEVISADVRQPPTTTQEQTVSGPGLASSVSQVSLRTRRRSKETTSSGSTLNCKTRMANKKGALKLRSVPTQGNQANLNRGANGNPSESELPAAIGEKIDRIGGVAVLEELRDTISDLRLHTCPLPAVVQESALMKPKRLRTGPPLAHKLLLLKEELELTELSEQIYRLRKRLALAEFFATYSAAQAHAGSFPIGEDGECSSNKPARKRRRRNRSPQGSRCNHCAKPIHWPAVSWNSDHQCVFDHGRPREAEAAKEHCSKQVPELEEMWKAMVHANQAVWQGNTVDITEGHFGWKVCYFALPS